MIEKISLTFSADELLFLDLAMRFLEGGFRGEEEIQRDEMAFRIRKVLSDIEDGFIPRGDNASFSIECAFCDGTGAFPDVLPVDATDPCPVCEGRGFNNFRTTHENILQCRFCGGGGKTRDNSGYATGEICQVCHGTGKVLLEPISESSASDILWGLMHPTIAKVSRSRFESGHYADSVEAAFKEINSAVKSIYESETGEELDGASLMQRAFSPNKPIICIGDFSTESGRNIQQGYMQIYAGAMTGIRNPKAHENLEIDSSRANHFLILASLLMFKLDERT
jgi:uncharacterized protein (TIGR02391 family)